MKTPIKILSAVGIILVIVVIIFIAYIILDMNIPWLHEYQTIRLGNNKIIKIYLDNFDDFSEPYISIEDNGKLLVTEKPIDGYAGSSSFSVIHSPLYEVIGITVHGANHMAVVALYDFETKDFWSSEDGNEEIGMRLLAKLTSYEMSPYMLHGSKEHKEKWAIFKEDKNY